MDLLTYCGGVCGVYQELLESEFEAVLSMSQTQVSKVLMELSDADARSNSPSLHHHLGLTEPVASSCSSQKQKLRVVKKLWLFFTKEIMAIFHEIG